MDTIIEENNNNDKSKETNKKMNFLENQQELINKQIRLRKHQIKELVLRQTDYDDETCNKLLIENNYDYSKIIKNYLNNNQEKKNTEKKKTINQGIYSEIRNLMDDAAKKHRIKTEIEKKQKEIYEKLMEYKNLMDSSNNLIDSSNNLMD